VFGRGPGKLKNPLPIQADDGSLSRMINSAGRVNLTLLQRIAQAVAREDFVSFMQKPVLAGSAIHQGNLAARRELTSREMNRTILFEPLEDSRESVSVSDSLKYAIYPLFKGVHATTAPNFIFIGRIDTNDFIMPDYPISRQHAVIEIKRDGYFLRDCGSTNGTFFNGTRLEKKLVPLSDKDMISFAGYEFAFLQPDSLFSMLAEKS
jgi:hypothetical protein